MHFYAFFNHFYGLIFYPYIAHEETAQNLDLSVRLSLFFLLSDIAPKIKVCSRVKSD